MPLKWPFICISTPRMDKTQQATPLNLATRKTITKAQTQALHELNQSFARTFSLSLSAWLGTNIQIGMTGAHRQVFTSMLETVEVEHNYFSLCHFSPVEGSAIISMDMKLITPVIHLGLGGIDMEEIPEQERELTDIDVAIMDILMSRLCVELNQLWAHCGLRSEYGQRVLPATLGRLYPRTEDMLCISYQMQIGNVQGTFQMVMSTAVSDMILRELVRQDSKRIQSPVTRQLLRSRLEGLKVEGALEMQPFRLSADQILNLEPGMVLRTDISEGADFFLSIEGGKNWTASPVCMGERRGARLIERLGAQPSLP